MNKWPPYGTLEYKEARRAYDKDYYSKNGAKKRLSNSRWAESNKDRMRVLQKRWRVENADRIREEQRKYAKQRRADPIVNLQINATRSLWRIKAKDRINSNQRARYSLDPVFKSKAKQQASNWLINNKEKRRAYRAEWAKGIGRVVILMNCQKRRALIKNASIDTRGIAQFRDLIRKKTTSFCYYCENEFLVSKVQLDHIFPLARSGPHSVTNLCVACVACNSSKRAKLICEWRTSGQLLFNF